MRWLSGAANSALAAIAYQEDIGLMAQPKSYLERFIPQFPYWAADNGCFSRNDSARFEPPAWLDWLESIAEHTSHCLFAVLPDVYGDGPATLSRSLPYASTVRGMGYPVAIVAQCGVTAATYPWHEADALFIGGPNEWHRSPEVDDLVREAHRRGVWSHDGRVNSERRLVGKRVMGFDSSDGTFLKFGPDTNLLRVRRWLGRQRRQLPMWEFSE